ncbi:MAG: glutamine--tRNA ligase/YqeY domain fusion protein [Deltaproteobacteria bacterium]|nr:glutamine--tRNA ligase/YqeY domain fusion protein [Deltaproteobacteria bacterium]
MSTDERTDEKPTDFLRAIIDEDLRTQKHNGRVATRFPPEPNGYLHIGHCKSICLNFGLAKQYGGTCNLRFDDTNPVKEDPEYVRSIQDDVRWLGFSFGETALYASDYFERMYELAEKLIVDRKAYVCSLSEEEIREYRGTLTSAGRNSPYRERATEENLRLFRQMRDGVFVEGTHVLRAKIDMSAANMKMRDPLLYRIKRVHHDRTGDRWNIYPFYDYAHPLSDAFEEITHSICTLEFENNRELYDWVIRETGVPWTPHQYEFARLQLEYTVMSKRKLLLLVNQNLVNGWDDPRMPTIAGMRRRGFRPEALRAFAELIGIAKNNSMVDIGKLEYCIRDDLHRIAPRVLAVCDPLKVTLTNYEEGAREMLDAPYFPADSNDKRTRKLPFGRTLLIERDDFREVPPKGYQRLAPGRVVRLRYGYCVRCDEVIKDPTSGEVTELRCTYFKDTLDGGQIAGEKIHGVIHWVDATESVACEVREYDLLLSVARPDADERDFTELLSDRSLVVHKHARVEPSIASDDPATRYQFERLGYFWRDPKDSRADALVFNRIVTLKESTRVPSAVEISKPSADEGPAVRETNTADANDKRHRPHGRTKAQVRAAQRDENPKLAEHFERMQSVHGLGAEEADLLSADEATAGLFEAVLREHPDAHAVARWMINEVARVVPGEDIASLKCTASDLAKLLTKVSEQKLTTPKARELLGVLARDGGDLEALLRASPSGAPLDSAALSALVQKVIADNADKASQYRSGKTGLMGFFVGQLVKLSAGAADPKAAQALLAAQLDAPTG